MLFNYNDCSNMCSDGFILIKFYCIQLISPTQQQCFLPVVLFTFLSAVTSMVASFVILCRNTYESSLTNCVSTSDKRLSEPIYLLMQDTNHCYKQSFLVQKQVLVSIFLQLLLIALHITQHRVESTTFSDGLVQLFAYDY